MLNISIVTPERAFFNAECLSATLPGQEGEMQLLAGHAALLAGLLAGVMTLEKSNHEKLAFMIGEGVVEVYQDQVNILCEQARWKSEIDKHSEEQLLGELQAQIRHEKTDDELKRLSAELERCTARLRLFE